MLSQPLQLRIRTRAREGLRVTRSDCTPTLPLESTRDHGRPTALRARLDTFVYEVDQLVCESNSDLLAHTGTVPVWYQPVASGQHECRRPAVAPGATAYGCAAARLMHAMSYCETAAPLFAWFADGVPSLPA